MNLTNLCPIPLAWTPYSLDFKALYAALVLVRELVATMTDAGDRTRAGPLLDWLRAACVRLGGAAGHERTRSLVNQNYGATTPDARVVRCMQHKIAPFRLPAPPTPTTTIPGGGRTAPVLNVTLASQTGEKEYSILETSKIQAVRGLTDAQWDTNLPKLYPECWYRDGRRRESKPSLRTSSVQ
jgi:hypothetical protein